MILPMLNTEKILCEMVSMGFKIFLDDFGAGYSSLSFIQRLPVSGIRIDRSFVQVVGNGEGDSQARNMLESLLTLGKNMGLTVVAEGIETPQQVDCLKARGYRKGQSFYFSKALVAKEVKKLFS